MDIRCPKCEVEYELDDARVPADGATVKCSGCQYVFMAHRADSPATLVVAPAPAPMGQWKVRQASGEVLICQDASELQRLITEGEVGPDDALSLTGESWKALKSVPELERFFSAAEDEGAGPTVLIGNVPVSTSRGPLPGAELERVVRGGRGKWIALILAGVGLGFAAGWYFVVSKASL